MFRKVLVANRGEIACRVIRTLKRLNIGSVAVYSDVDRHSRHVRDADEAVRLGPGPAAQSYLQAEKIIVAARACGAEAIHPGYGFLSENADFAESCAAANLVFIGPTPRQMREFGLKHRARDLAREQGVPLLPGSELLTNFEAAARAARAIGYPLMLKSTAGGGGIGMQLVRRPQELADAFSAVERLARKNFSQGGVYLEKYIERARHIEVQIFGDGKGHVVSLGERDCSVQRRNQKIIEETPAPGLSAALRRRLYDAAVRLAQAVQYRSAGTVEFVFDVATEEFYFLEVNTRLQVEHGVTEEVTGVDLVEWMIRQAADAALPLAELPTRGAAIQVRLYAEDPARGFRPSTGMLTRVQFPARVRVESWVEDGTPVSPHYDPLLAKLIVSGRDRDEAILKMRAALDATGLAGIETNLDYLRAVVADPRFAAGGITTRSLDDFAFASRSLSVIAPGTQTTIQDYPGRTGYWNVGVPPSGPMDSLSFRLANRVVGNPSGTAALEMTMVGPTLQFGVDALIGLCGARLAAQLDGEPIGWGVPVRVRRGQVLQLGQVQGAGCRAYLAVQGGFEVPAFLGSRSTFTLGRFGGHGGRALQVGDVLHLGLAADAAPDRPAPRAIPPQVTPQIGDEWEIGVLYGPHGAPDFFTAEDIDDFFSARWEVHYNSNRTGVRLLGPRPTWARSDGGEAGLHPSNIHDNAYAIGAIDFTGDMPVILGPDGPSLGGFVCPATVAHAELWKLGQLRPNDHVRFRRLDAQEALELEHSQELLIESLAPPRRWPEIAARSAGRDDPVLASLPAQSSRPSVVYRRCGDRYLLIEYGPPVLDLELRLRVHALSEWLQARASAGILELTPGIRSLQVHYDPHVLPLAPLLEMLLRAEESLAAIDEIEVPTRIVRLPLSWDDAATQLAIEKYMQSVRADAPWCPSNIEFIRRINGLANVDEVKRIVFDASYLVLGLGDVYLGAPVATPIDPRHRLVTTKYNPARTWTPENAVGIGGAYLCVYGMEGPGGYQFIGRTCQMWNTYHGTREFRDGKPWLLRCFDQIRFHEVSGGELAEFREDFLHGQAHLEISEEMFALRDYRRFLAANAQSIAAQREIQRAAFDAERRRWVDGGQIGYETDLPPAHEDAASEALPADCIEVASPVAGSVWRIASELGQRVRAGDTLVLVESMKMELPILAPVDGVIAQLRCTEGRAVQLAQTLIILRTGNNP